MKLSKIEEREGVSVCVLCVAVSRREFSFQTARKIGLFDLYVEWRTGKPVNPPCRAQKIMQRDGARRTVLVLAASSIVCYCAGIPRKVQFIGRGVLLRMLITCTRAKEDVDINKTWLFQRSAAQRTDMRDVLLVSTVRRVDGHSQRPTSPQSQCSLKLLLGRYCQPRPR